MNKEDAIKYLHQLYPNGGHCWLDEQRIEAIGMAINSLKEEPVSEEWIEELRTKLNSMSKEDFKKVFDKYAIDFNEEPVSEDLEEAAKRYATEGDEISGFYIIDEEVEAFKAGAQWGKNQAMAEIQAQSMALAHGCHRLQAQKGE